MRKIDVADVTVRRSEEFSQGRLSFRLKLELAKMLDSLGITVIEAPAIKDCQTDYYLVKSIASAVKGASVAVPVDIADPESAARTWDALKEAVSPRLQLPFPVSTVQMEYFCHKKPAVLLQLIEERVKQCKALCPQVEFLAGDFSRAEKDFLLQAIGTAVKGGATVISLSDAAGDLLPDQFGQLIAEIKGNLPEDVKLGVICSNDLFLADACAIEAVKAGADEIKTSSYGRATTSLEHFPCILEARKDILNASCSIDMTRLQSAVSTIGKLCEEAQAKSPTFIGVDTQDDEIRLTAHDDLSAVLKAVKRLGYELTEEDSRKVYDAFTRLSSGSNEIIEAKELDAIVASVAFQVPPTWKLESFLINSGNIISATCHIRLIKDNEVFDCACVGDGPVDAAFLAIEKVVGVHYELDDFQIRAVTEGREAMGETVVRLRSEGKVYSGRGVSTDIVGSSIMAYLNAVNKIAYEEGQA